MNESTDYEQERLRNIKENEALMRELGVLHGSEAIGAPRRRPPPSCTPASRSSRSRAAPSPAKKADSKPTRVMPKRSSARLAGHEADSDVVKRRYEEEAEQLRQEAERAKRARHGQHDLAAMTGGQLEELQIKALEDTLASLASNMAKAAELVDIGQEKKRRRDDKTAARSELEAVLNSMKLRSADKVTQKRVYSMAYHPTTDKDLIFIGDKEGSIGVWDAAAERAKADSQGGNDGDADEPQYFPEGKAWSLQVHGKSPVTSLKLDPVSSNTLFSSSYDATIRRLDLVTQKSDEVWAGEDNVLLSIFDILAPFTHASAFTATPNSSLDERSIWIADHRGGLTHIDLREGKRGGAKSRRWQVCEKKIGALSVNRLAPHCIATASLDQHVRLFDVRALATISETTEAPYNYKNVDEEDLENARTVAQIGAHKARQACTSVDFSPRGDQLVGVSYDDVVKVWDLQHSWLHSRYAVVDAKTDPDFADAGVKTEGTESPARRSRRSTTTTTTTSPTKAIKTGPKSSLLSWIKSAPSSSLKTESPSLPDDILSSPTVIPHNNQTGKWLTLFRARWNENNDIDPHFCMGSMTRRAEIYAGDGTLLRTLWDEEIVTAVPAVCVMHPNRVGRLATGNASGRCTFWMPDEHKGEEREQDQVKKEEEV